MVQRFGGNAWRRRAWLALAVLIVPVMAACGSSGGTSSSSGTGGSVNVALNTTLSGSFGFFGLANQNAVTLAIEQLNSKGGLLGKHINLQIKDDTAKPDVGTELVRNEILNDNVVALFGGVSSSVALAEQSVAGQYKVPFILHTSNTDQLTIQKFNQYTYSVVPNTGMEGRANAMAASKLPYTKYYLLGPNYEFGHSQLAAFKAELTKLKPGVQFVGEDYPALGATDYSSYISKIQAAQPEIIYSAEYAGDLITFLTQSKSAGLLYKESSPKFMDLFDVDTLRNLGANAPTGVYSYGRAPFFAINTPEMTTFVNAFKARYNIPPSDWAVMAYDAVTLWAEGVKKANSFSGTAVANALSGITFDSTRGKMTERSIDHECDCAMYEGTLQYDATLNFASFANLQVIPGSQILLSPSEVTALRSGS